MFYENWWTDRAGFDMEGFFDISYNVLQDNLGISKIKAIFSKTLSQSLDFKKFAVDTDLRNVLLTLFDKGECSEKETSEMTILLVGRHSPTTINSVPHLSN